MKNKNTRINGTIVKSRLSQCTIKEICDCEVYDTAFASKKKCSVVLRGVPQGVVPLNKTLQLFGLKELNVCDSIFSGGIHVSMLFA